MSQQLVIDGPPNRSNEELVAPELTAKEALSSKKIAQLSATHYGWCAYDNIDLMGPTGLERRVIYDANGDFGTMLRRGQLVVFQNVDIRMLDERDNNIPNGRPPQLVDVVKYAATCAGEIQDAYSDWGAVIFMQLIGMTPSAAFDIFKTIQPKPFKLAYLEDELIYEAPKRILKDIKSEARQIIAETTRKEMLIGARLSIMKAELKVDLLQTDIAAFPGTKVGKSRGDRGDLHAFDQLELEPPAPISRQGAARGGDLNDIRELLARMAERDLARGTTSAKEDLQLSEALDTAQMAQLKQALEASATMQKKQEAMERKQKELENELRELRKQANKAAKAN